MEYKTLIRCLCAFFIIMYTLSWFTPQPTKTIWGVGVSLPWFSLFASLPILFLGNVEEKDNWKIWCYIYALATLLYIIVVPMLGGKFLHLLPHLGCCIMGILAAKVFHTAKR